MQNRILVFLALSALLIMVGCGSGGGGASGGGEGTLSLSLTDLPAGRYQAVYVTIEDVQVHLRGNANSPNNWKSIEQFEGPKTVNLLELVNGVREELGLVSLPAGRYTQMRLMIGSEPEEAINLLSQAHRFANYVIEQGDPPTIHELKVPSGYQTGVKLVRGFDISANRTTELMLDFDAGRSVVQAGASGKWLLKPTIRVVDVDEYAIVNGTVEDPEAETPIPGAMVSLQVYDPEAADPKEQVKVIAATVTDKTGGYQLFVAPDAYHLVVYAPGYKVGLRKISLEEGALLTIDDIKLEAVKVGEVSGKVELGGAGEEQYATLSFRQTVSVNEENEITEIQIEIQSVNILDGHDYEITLPIDDYTIVGSSFGYESQTVSIRNTTDRVEKDLEFGEL